MSPPLRPEQQAALTDYVRRQQRGGGNPSDTLGTPPDARGNLPAVSGFITRSMLPYFEARGITANQVQLLQDLPEEMRQKLASAIPNVVHLGLDYDYKGLMGQVAAARDRMTPEAFEGAMVTGVMGQALQNHREGTKLEPYLDLPYATSTMQEHEMDRATYRSFFHALTFGAVDAPGPPKLADPRQYMAHEALGSVFGLGLQGYGMVRALGWVTKIPQLATALAGVPARYQEIASGVLVASAMEAARPGGLPEDPGSLDIPARIAKPISNILGDSPVAQRTALAIGGGVTGGVLGEIIGGVVRGARVGRQALASILHPDDLAAVRTALTDLGIEVAPGAAKKEVVDHLFANLSKIPLSERLAETVGERLNREQHVTNMLIDRLARPGAVGAAGDLDENVAYVASVFRANPGGMSIVKGITTDVSAGKAVMSELGYGAVVVQRGESLAIARPKIVFPEPELNARATSRLNKFREIVESQNEGRTTTGFTILPDGKIVRGAFDPAAMNKGFGIHPLRIQGELDHGRAFREGLRTIMADVDETGGLIVDLPRSVSQKQVGQLLRLVGRNVPSITIRPAAAGIPPIVIKTPMVPQVEDALARVIPEAKDVGFTPEMMKRLQQFQKTGVFEGQAAILPDGYPVQVLRRNVLKGGEATIHYRDPLTGARHAIPESNISLLPSSLEGEYSPSTMFLSSLPAKEQKLYAQLRYAVNEDLAKPITTFTQLDGFASARGFRVSSQGKGAYSVWDANTGESVLAKNLKAAVRLVRQGVGPIPEVTPPQIEELLGFGTGRINAPIGGNMPTARFNERIPITEEEFDRVLNEKTLQREPLDAVTLLTKPTQGLMAVIERKYNVPAQRMFINYQTQNAHRTNFIASWLDGGPHLPEGITPLKQIVKIAGGTKADQRLLTQWLESGSDASAIAALEQQMTVGERKAAPLLRGWYDGLFKNLDVEAAYLQDYAPHIRTQMESGQKDITEIWRRTFNQKPVPRFYDFFADNYRHGTLDAYEDRSFVSAMQYLNDGSHNRYMKPTLKEFNRLIHALPDLSVRKPLEDFFQAVKGFEFQGQRAALNSAFTGIMKNLGIEMANHPKLGERLANTFLGFSYSATMNFRPSLGIRNFTQSIQTTWPLLGGIDDTMAEAFGRAMTRAGRDEAVRAGALVMRNTPFMGEDEVANSLPKWLNALNEGGMKMYNTADEFTRSVSYHAGYIKAQKAIGNFAQAVQKGGNLADARRALIIEAGAAPYDTPVVNEFIRRVGDSPEAAASFLGKHATDLSQYLYGRGYQMKWMRSVPGRFVGQFGTWTFGYLDFVSRATANMVRNGYQGEAMKFLGRLAISNLAFYYAGKELLNLDLRRWMGANSLFWTGGPAVELGGGLMDVMRGVPDYLSDPNSPFGEARVSQGAQIMARTGQSFIPLHYALRDLARLGKAIDGGDPSEIVGSILNARPMKQYTVQQQLDVFTNVGRMVTESELETQGDFSPSAVELMQYGMNIRQEGREGGASGPRPLGQLTPPARSFPVPPRQPLGGSPTTGQPQNPGGQAGGNQGLSPTAGQTPSPPGNRPGLPPNLKIGESRPVQQ